MRTLRLIFLLAVAAGAVSWGAKECVAEDVPGQCCSCFNAGTTDICITPGESIAPPPLAVSRSLAVIGLSYRYISSSNIEHPPQ